MADSGITHNPLTCIGWDPYPAVAICEHPGCPWTSDATDITTQTETFLAHHNHRHQD